MKLKHFALAAALAISADGFAHTVKSCDDYNHWRGAIDTLIWHTRKGDLDYAVLQDGSGNDLSFETIDLCYHPGVRVMFFHDHNRWSFGGTYTYFSQSDLTRTEPGSLSLHPTQVDEGHQVTSSGSIQCASGRYKVQLHQIDALSSHLFQPVDNVNVSVFGGGRLTFLDQKVRYTYSAEMQDIEDNEEECEGPNGGDFDTVSRHFCMTAGGFVLGGSGCWNFSEHFALKGETSLATQIAGIDRDYRHVANEERVATLSDCHWKVLNTLALSLGTEYTYCTERWGKWSAFFGYEMQQWFNLSQFLAINGNNNNDEKWPDRGTESLGFDGFVLRIGAAY